MSTRLTFAEFDLLNKLLKGVETGGNDLLNGVHPPREVIRTVIGAGTEADLIGAGRMRAIDHLNKIRLVREKLENIAGQ